MLELPSQDWSSVQAKLTAPSPSHAPPVLHIYKPRGIILVGEISRHNLLSGDRKCLQSTVIISCKRHRIKYSISEVQKQKDYPPRGPRERIGMNPDKTKTNQHCRRLSPIG